MAERKLTTKQKLFIKHYAKLRNATRAAIEAGYSEDSAYQLGAETLKNLEKEIKAEIDKQSDRIDVEIDDIVRELNLLAFSDITDFYYIDEGGGMTAKPIDEIPVAKRRCIESIQEDRAIRESPDGTKITMYDKVKFKLHSKPKAIEMLGRYKAMFADNINIKGKIKHEHEVSIQDIMKNIDNDT